MHECTHDNYIQTFPHQAHQCLCVCVKCQNAEPIMINGGLIAFSIGLLAIRIECFVFRDWSLKISLVFHWFLIPQTTIGKHVLFELVQIFVLISFVVQIIRFSILSGENLREKNCDCEYCLNVEKNDAVQCNQSSELNQTDGFQLNCRILLR